MSTSVDEAMQDQWQATHPYMEDVRCDCGATWRVKFIDGEPVNPEQMGCYDCAGDGGVA